MMNIRHEVIPFIGMMKFGSRLDIHMPAADMAVLVSPGDRVRAGETIIARMKCFFVCGREERCGEPRCGEGS